jgi:hypothetical protein
LTQRRRARILFLSQAQPLRQQQRAELERLFDADIDVGPLSPAGMVVDQVIATILNLDVDAVMAQGIGPELVVELTAHANELVVLRPIVEMVPGLRGLQPKTVGHGQLTTSGNVEPLDDGALATV